MYLVCRTVCDKYNLNLDQGSYGRLRAVHYCVVSHSWVFVLLEDPQAATEAKLCDAAQLSPECTVATAL